MTAYHDRLIAGDYSPGKPKRATAKTQTPTEKTDTTDKTPTDDTTVAADDKPSAS